MLWDTAEFLHQEDPKVYVQRWYSDSDTSVETYKAKCSDTRRGEWIPNWKSYDPVNNMPYVVYDTEESALRAELNTAVDTFVVEKITAFILGTQDIEAGWDAYVKARMIWVCRICWICISPKLTLIMRLIKTKRKGRRFRRSFLFFVIKI